VISRTLIVSCVLSAAFAVSCGGPFFLFPGGALKGPTEAPPADWSFTEAIKTVKVETRPAEPYSVTLWVVSSDDQLYLHAGPNRTAWVTNIKADPAVRISIDGKIYDMKATRVEDTAEFAKFADAYEKKYGSRPKNEHVSEVYVYRLSPR
jgi:hypothetical protein